MILSVRARIWTYWETRTDEPCSFCLVFLRKVPVYSQKITKKNIYKTKKKKSFVIKLDLSLVLSVYLILV